MVHNYEALFCLFKSSTVFLVDNLYDTCQDMGNIRSAILKKRVFSWMYCTDGDSLEISVHYGVERRIRFVLFKGRGDGSTYSSTSLFLSVPPASSDSKN